MIPLDATFSVAEFSSASAPDYRNDDGSTPQKTLPFNFCFYGTTYNSVFINNNGNISFGSSITGYSAGGFPAGSSTVNDTVMIAPFWADVDTRDNGSGLVYYKITPTYMVIKWDHVGYYSNHSDLVNDFQVIITDGFDPILPDSNNVALCYGDMQWTTGDVGGTNGFGGNAANAGINKGDGSNFIQFGRFDQSGSAYDGQYNNNDGIDYLDNKSYYLSTCSPGNNIPPVLTPYISACDSFKICNPTDTLIYLLNFTSPEEGQNVTSITASAPSLGSAFTVLDTTLGQAGSILFQIIANPGLIGNHVITVNAVDDGSPSASSTITYVVPILAGTQPDNPIVSVTPSIICANSGSATFSLTNASDYDGYTWSNGVSGAPITVTDDNVYYVTVNKNGCFKSIADSVEFNPSPTPEILGTLALCGSNTTDLVVDSASLYTSISWSTGDTNDSLNVPAGTYSVTVTAANGCSATSPSVTVSTSNLSISAGSATFCDGDSTLLTANAIPSGGAVYDWFDSSGSSSVYVDTTGTYFVTVSYANGCFISDTISVVSIPVGVPITTFSYNTPVCKLGENPVPIIAPDLTPGGTYSSSPGLSINPSTGIINLTASSAGTYTVTYTVPASTCGPQGTTSTGITIQPIANSVLGFNYQAVCASDTNQLPLLDPGFTSGGVFSAAPGLSINDSTGEVGVSSSTPGSYLVTYTIADDTTVGVCRAGGFDTATIKINPLPSIGITSDQTIWIGNSVTLTASGGIDYSWSPALGLSCVICDTAIAAPVNTTNYCVTVIDTMGCIDSSCVRISIEIPCVSNHNLEMPNAFTPNGDGYNDELCNHGWDECVTSFSIYIYDRWGEKVYESSDPNFCWNGIYKGELLDPAVFVYFIRASYVTSGETPSSDTTKIEVNKKGNISLVR
jgi:gliding motility-associated-like protein